MSVILNIKGEVSLPDKEISILQAGQIISYLGSQQPMVNNSEGRVITSPMLIQESTDSPKKIIEESKAKTFPEKITVLGKYIQDRDNNDQFSINEIRSIFIKMGSLPKNFSRDIKLALNDLNYIFYINKKEGLYAVTDNGKEAIESGFPIDKTQFKKRPSNSKKTKSLSLVSENIKNMEISGTMDEYPLFNELKTKGQKILWLLAYAEEKGIKSLLPIEVEHLSLQLRDRIASSGFTALNTANQKLAYVTKIGAKFSIQQKGIDFLKKMIDNKDVK